MTALHGAAERPQALVVTSGGGHWEQMMLLRPALAGYELIYATTVSGIAERSGIENSHLVADCNRNQPGRIPRCVADIWQLVRTVRPQLVISTGAAPGIIALALGRLHGAKTVWIDSVANSEQLSMSGRLAGSIVDLQVTQWEHLARNGRPTYLGSLL